MTATVVHNHDTGSMTITWARTESDPNDAVQIAACILSFSGKISGVLTSFTPDFTPNPLGRSGYRFQGTASGPSGNTLQCLGGTTPQSLEVWFNDEADMNGEMTYDGSSISGHVKLGALFLLDPVS